MEQFSIKYGGGDLSLKKSPRIVAVRAAVGRESQAIRSIERCQGACTGQSLEGFMLAEVDDAVRSMEESLEQMRSDPHIDVGTHVFHTSDDGVPFVPTGEVFIQFCEESSDRECQKMIDQLALEVIGTRGKREALLRVTRRSPNPLKVVAELQKSSHIVVAEPELATPARLMMFASPSDGLLNWQWHLRNTGSLGGSTLGLKAGADARVVAAWEAAESLGSRDVIVAVIDDGFDLGHPDLSGAGKTVAPWDFTRNNDRPAPGTPQWDSRNQEWIGDWHGTACAGVAVGNANGSGIVGAAPNCRLMPVRWGPNLSDSQIESWFDHVRVQGAWVVSCSWGAAARVFRLSTRARDAIRQCARQGRNGQGCVVLFAAGNEESDVDDLLNAGNDRRGPAHNGFATHPDVIAVAACTSRDEKSDYSNFGAAISICAPSSGAGGRGILTADVRGTFVGRGRVNSAGYAAGDFTGSFGGTSSATPLAAGIAALVLSRKPNLTAAEVKTLLQRTARRIGPAGSYDVNGHSRDFGFGCVNALEAVEEASE